MPEEYRLLGQFVDRVEQSAVQRREAAMLAERAALDEAKAGVPDQAFEMTLEEAELSARWVTLLCDEGYETAAGLRPLEYPPRV